MKIKDIFEFILQAQDIEREGSMGSDITIPIYDISVEDLLKFAENALVSETKEGLVNAISNLKRALDCEMDMFFESINLKRIIKKNNLKFEKRLNFWLI